MKQKLPHVLTGLVAVAATLVGLFDPVDTWLRDWRFGPSSRGSSDPPAIVEMVEPTLQGLMPLAAGPAPTIIGLALISLLFVSLQRRVDWKRDAVLAVALMAAIEAAAYLLQRFLAVPVATAAWHFSLALYLAASLWRVTDVRRIPATLALDGGRAGALLFGQVMNDAADGIIVAEYGGKVVSINPAARRIIAVGATAGRVAPTLADILPADFAQAALPAVEEAATGTGAPAFRDIELTGTGADSTYIELAVTRSILPGRPGRTVVTLTFSDVSERRRADALAMRAAEEVFAASRAKGAFLAGISHELRTPLNAIIGFSDMLRKEMMGPVGMPCYLDYAGHIHESGNQLLHLVNDVLDLTRFEAGQLAVQDEPVDPRHILSGVSAAVSGWPETRARDLSWQMLCDNVLVRADARILKQSLINLVSNAVRFTRPGGRISVRVCLTGTGELEFRVCDNGIGVAKEAVPHLTLPFYQADTQLTRGQGGSGLGLAVVESYARAHDGRLAFDSAPGQGTRVSIILPAERLIVAEVAPNPQYVQTAGW